MSQLFSTDINCVPGKCTGRMKNEKKKKNDERNKYFVFSISHKIEMFYILRETKFPVLQLERNTI